MTKAHNSPRASERIWATCELGVCYMKTRLQCWVTSWDPPLTPAQPHAVTCGLPAAPAAVALLPLGDPCRSDRCLPVGLPWVPGAGQVPGSAPLASFLAGEVPSRGESRLLSELRDSRIEQERPREQLARRSLRETPWGGHDTAREWK